MDLALTEKDIARFWAKVDKSSECWEWTASRNAGGYGQMAVRKNGKFFAPLAHRISYVINVGQVPAGKFLDHRCHNRACVNPKHLRVVVRKENQENRAGATRTSRTGVRGVYLAPNGKYVAAVREGKKRHYVGIFSRLDDAAAAAIAKRNELFTHNDLDRTA